MCFPFQQPLSYVALAVSGKQGSQLRRKENQSTSVHLSQAGDQIEKWIAGRARHSDRRWDGAAISLSTCFQHDNGHHCCRRLAKRATLRVRFSISWRRRWAMRRCDLRAGPDSSPPSVLHGCLAGFILADISGC